MGQTVLHDAVHGLVDKPRAVGHEELAEVVGHLDNGGAMLVLVHVPRELLMRHGAEILKGKI